MTGKPLRIAFLGSRGIPARYSGFETFYEQISTRLSDRGHSVTVYNRSHFIKDVRKRYRNVRIVTLPCIQTKHLETISHTFISTLHAVFENYDIVYYCIVGNSPLAWVPRMTGAMTLINVDGEDWRREKWGVFARKYQKACEKIACFSANLIISDAHAVQDRYLKEYGKDTIFAPYGANIRHTPDSDRLKKWGLSPDGYILYVGRLVPENGIDILIQSFLKISTAKKLVIAGDAPYMDGYKKYLMKLSSRNKNIVFTGYVFKEDYEQLSSHAYVAVQPSGIEGTRPALLDQMGFGNCVVVRNTKVNMEVIDDYGLFFDHNSPVRSLAEVLEKAILYKSLVRGYRKKVRERIEKYYNWDAITDFYEDLFNRLLKRRSLVTYDVFLENETIGRKSSQMTENL